MEKEYLMLNLHSGQFQQVVGFCKNSCTCLTNLSQRKECLRLGLKEREADLSLHWAHRLFVGFDFYFNAAAQIYYIGLSI